MDEPRFLTKSRFKLATECPAKLFYTGKRSLYADRNLEDPFLAALAEGGFQVGELARCYFPGGVTIDSLDHEAALLATSEHLARENAVLFEAAARFENLFIRADILEKRGNRLDLIEVKAKSFDPRGADPFVTGKGDLRSEWKPYLYDVAFQKHVLSRAFPEATVRAWLMMADKTARCPTDGLHQKFRVARGADGRARALPPKEPLTTEEMEKRILCRVNVDRECDLIFSEGAESAEGPADFAGRIRWFADHYEKDEKIECAPSPACAACEFRATPEDEQRGLKSGFKECWSRALGWRGADFERPTVLDIWNFRDKARLLGEGRATMSQVTEMDIAPRPDGKPGLSASQRQWLQVERAQNSDDTPWVDRDALRDEMARWRHPLHFIDFESTMVAIPFNRGRRPYEMVAFQFSHHVVHEGGRVEHRGQYINAGRGAFPNYEFIRALRAELEGDGGSIFRYAAHENSVLAAIHGQLADDPRPPADWEELRGFIRSISTSPKGGDGHWEGERAMVDMCALVRRYYYAPSMGGSNSIKRVLPAILRQSRFLRDRYSAPIYGAPGGIPSHNFAKKIWIVPSGDGVADPYDLLPKMFCDVSDRDLGFLDQDEELREGGAAMTAYARMQFEEMGDRERGQIRDALLRYCELDTLAMVMIYEAWADMVGARP